MVFRTIVYLRWSGLGSTTYTHPRPCCLFLSGETGGFSFLMVKEDKWLPSFLGIGESWSWLPSFLLRSVWCANGFLPSCLGPNPQQILLERFLTGLWNDGLPEVVWARVHTYTRPRPHCLAFRDRWCREDDEAGSLTGWLLLGRFLKLKFTGEFLFHYILVFL